MAKRLAYCILFLCTILLAFAPENAIAQSPESDTTSITTKNDSLISQDSKPVVGKSSLPKNEKKHNTTSVKIEKPHNPKKATIMSACLPGLGQIYNKKWWKVPIVYAGVGGLGYLVYSNRHEYNRYLLAYRISTNNLNEGEVPSEDAIQLAASNSSSTLQYYKDSYRRDFELYCILFVAWYGLNIVDATVDGHLYSYDISDDLSLSIDPSIISNNFNGFEKALKMNGAGLSFKLNF